VVINLIPAVARLVGNWRLKALKAVAAANPIENLEMIYRDKMNALAASRENINATYAILQDLYNQIKEHDATYPGKPSQWLDKYNKLKALVELRGEKYKASKVKLQDFSAIIDETRSDWKIAQTMAQANTLANVGEAFESQLMQDTALTTVQDGLNLAFAELDTALLDEAPTSATVVAAPAAPKAIAQTSSACSVSMPQLDLEEPITIDAGPVPLKTSRRNSYLRPHNY